MLLDDAQYFLNLVVHGVILESREVNFACIDLAHCSPRRPNPTCILLAHCNVWCSRRCILMGVVAFGNAFLKLSIKFCMAVAIESKRKNGPSNRPSFVPFRHHKYT